MLDSGIASFIIRGVSPPLDQRFRRARPASLCISVITRGELLLGVALKPGSQNLARVVDEFLSVVSCMPWENTAASAYARCAADLQQAGQAIGTMDTLIAAHALALDAVLVTHNLRHFSKVPGLRVEDWSTEQP